MLRIILVAVRTWGKERNGKLSGPALPNPAKRRQELPHEFRYPPQRPRQRPAAHRQHRTPLHPPCRRFGAGELRRHPRAVHRQHRGSRPGMAARQGRGLGHRRIRHAAARHQHPHAARSGARRPGRPHHGDPAPDRPQPARLRQPPGAGRARHHARLRRAAGRRRHAHGGDHRRLRGAGRCGRTC